MKARLLKGSRIVVHGITIKNYTLGEIFDDIGLTRYLQMSSLANRKPKDFLTSEFINQVPDFTLFDVLCISSELNEIYLNFLNFFTGYEWEFIANEAFIEFHSINENGERVYVNKGNFDSLLDVVKATYCLDKSKRESDRDDIDDEMKELLMEFEEESDKVRKAKGSNITIIGIIDGVSNKHPSINLFNIWGYTIYQLMNTYYALSKIDNESRIMSGIYHGTVDSKAIDLESIHWANES